MVITRAPARSSSKSELSANNLCTATQIGDGQPSVKRRTASTIVLPLEMMSSTSTGVRPRHKLRSLSSISTSRSPCRTPGIRVIDALLGVNSQLGTTTLIITHNASIQGVADRVLSFADGQISGIHKNEKRRAAAELSW